ncbi:GAF and ANTAR domain-containing protein [Curtobacterium flaccumfaciens pv. flaccumfaciens]|uniref:GAF and ANTAR domain-containing protein n=1 Tax=Curtobacterium flaccumfaciens TaxID=2035 RepID=UPI001ADC8024|nr:GAF and ANTAR domain-containing protein [Curtobacterium flaccumfaciens]MBO9047133.1 GAF and ANTAR domain-containing protein [Curtobacterium flaccumfaciens pv. flaccumfaciens]MBO9056969.1 GAF and ANTAR domain-containing protein [Curtobacterium flaccumfaciens pv. flaccumfaciens]QTR91963.1 GAF and ANTAR domain-containing protein [Curtobacterium flaccumfaciens pv. flaccumfaciens]QVG67269.1 GAF and ANTAR domain-containing protein [Curtobacterium flaccumfaciens pv. flaccumfaciens]
MDDAFERALRALRSAEISDDQLSRPFALALPMGGVSISTFGDLCPSETVSATDEVATRVDEIQFDLSEGPCWAALATDAPVLETDLVQRPNAAWPAFNEAVRSEPVGAVFAFPVAFGPFPLGAVDVYVPQPATIEDDTVRQAMTLASAVSRRVLRRALRSIADEDDALLDRSPSSRRVVHQATGVVLAQLDISPEDAYLLLQGHAFARRTTMRRVAEEILDGTVRFEKRGDLIEEVQ